ncbi:MAG: hypothetical protein IT384_17735 [Deltaproteobacteria bacterium]|nr:hypothetical protein [Deltaproteobacteria bacterium]
MSQVEKTAAEQRLKSLQKQASKLAELVELATRTATRPEVRRDGARFAEVLEEWVDDLKDLIETQDESTAEKLASFQTRLNLAEAKVEHWKLPPELLARAANAPARREKKRHAKTAA